MMSEVQCVETEPTQRPQVSKPSSHHVLSLTLHILPGGNIFSFEFTQPFLLRKSNWAIGDAQQWLALCFFLSQKVPDWDDQWCRNDSWHLRSIITYEVFVICLILMATYKKGVYPSFMVTKVRIQSVPSNQGHVAAKWTTQVSTQTLLSLNLM